MGHFRDLRSLGLAGVRMSSCVFRCNARRAACRPVCMGAVAVLTRAFLTWSYAGTSRFSVDRGNGADIVTRGLTTATRGRRRAGTAIAALLLVAAMTGCSTSADRVPSSAAIPTHSLRSDPRQAAVDQPATSQPAPGTVVHQTLSTPGASQIAAHAATARQLAAGRWTRLPAAPIGGRSGAAITWTGEEMLIWGGSRPDQRLTTDGAAYNPQTSRWRVLPRSPLEARSDMSSVWTGSTWFIWGGYRGAAGPKSVDGATYTPGTNTWRLLPPSQIKITSDNEQVQTVWTGTNVVVVAVATEASHATESPVTTASYDPDTNSWSSDPDLVLPQHHPAAELQLAADGGHLYLWSQWNYNANGFGYSGTDTFSMTLPCTPGSRSTSTGPATAASPVPSGPVRTLSRVQPQPGADSTRAHRRSTSRANASTQRPPRNQRFPMVPSMTLTHKMCGPEVRWSPSTCWPPPHPTDTMHIPVELQPGTPPETRGPRYLHHR